jgi:hypothetical protein
MVAVRDAHLSKVCSDTRIAPTGHFSDLVLHTPGRDPSLEKVVLIAAGAASPLFNNSITVIDQEVVRLQ